MPAAASQVGLQCQLQQQGGSDRAELSSASSLSLQLPSCMRSLIGKLLKLMIMINAYDMCVCVRPRARAWPQPAFRPGP